DPVDVTVPRSRSPSLAGVTIHRPRDCGDLGAVTRQGIAVTNPLRTLLDLGAVDADGAAAAVEHFIVARTVSPLALRAVLKRHARSGRPGITALREALANWPLGSKPPDSVLEAAMARLLQRH